MGTSFSFSVIWSLDSAISGQAIPSSFGRYLSAVTQLYSKPIKRLTIEDITNDLQIEMDEGIIIRTFVSDPNDEESWHIRDLDKGIRIIGNPRSIQTIKDIM